jgi:hypothetical protein
MTTGVVLHAFGGDKFDYYTIADNCTKLVTKFLGLPVTLVTDKEPVNRSLYDQVILSASLATWSRTLVVRDDTSSEYKEKTMKYPFKNDTRALSLELSPYDVTILLDSDYLVFNSELLKFVTLDCDFLCPWFAHDITGKGGYEGFRYINDTIPQAWATVVIFNKSIASRAIFDYWKLIQKNYEYYQALMLINSHFRNDYALSLAAHTLNGCRPLDEKLPPMMMLPARNYIEKIDTNKNIIINCMDTIIKVSNTNLHVMNKLCLQSQSICQDIDALTS